MSHQDWQTVTISKPKPKVKVSQPQNIQTPIKVDEAGNITKVKKVSQKMAKAVVDARLLKKWTQIQLAHNSCVDVKTIGEIERGGSLYNATTFNKICKGLGVKIDRDVDII